MNQDKKPKNLSLIKHHVIPQQELLLEYLLKVEAMVEMLMFREMIVDYSKSRLYNYLWAICDLIAKAKELNEDLIGYISKITASIIVEISSTKH